MLPPKAPSSNPDACLVARPPSHYHYQMHHLGLIVLLACLGSLHLGCKRPAPPAKTPDVGPRVTIGAPKKPPAKHLSSKGCSGCHPNQYKEWKRSLHALAHSEPV